MITERVRLIEGIKVRDRQCRDVELRLPIVRDSIEAEKESDGKGVLCLTLALVAKCIVKIGAFDARDNGWAFVAPPEEVTVDLLALLNEEDLQRLQEVREYLKKKVHWQSSD